MPVYAEYVRNWLIAHSADFPSIAEKINSLQIDWENTLKNILSYATTGIGSLLGSTFSVVGTLFGGIVDFVIALIFAVYLLANKERLARNIQEMMAAYMKTWTRKKVMYVVQTADNTFSRFIVGQCTEAVILGSLCTIGMFIFQFPYAPMIGAFIGATALIPIVGAYLGAALGAFMIFTISPIKALLFLVFLIILQQLEGNLIYPKVVGSSIGLPGMWVLAAVTVGGSIGGIPGMLVGVPLAATAYKLLRDDVHGRCRPSKTPDGKEPGRKPEISSEDN